MEFIPNIVKKSVEINTQMDGNFTYRPFVVIREKFLGILFPVKYYVQEDQFENLTNFYNLKQPGRYTYFRTYETQDVAIYCLDKAIEKYRKTKQEKINKIVIKRTVKQVWP